jgi:transcriptional regulator of acetoin/glycerol metabolism
LILASGPFIEIGEWLPQVHTKASGLSKLEQIEREEILHLMELHQGNLSQVAKGLGISRTTLWRRLKDYNLQSGNDSPDVAD